MESTLQPPPPLTTSLSLSSTSAPASEPIHDALARDFPQLANLTKDELTELLEDETHFDAFANTIPQALELHQIQEQRLRANLALAQKNEGMRPELEALRAETARLFNEANELKARWALLDEAQNEAIKRFSPQAQLARLRAATSNQDHLSEQLISSFIDGGMSEEDFARQFKEVRRVYHKRKVCLDKWEKGSVVWRT